MSNSTPPDFFPRVLPELRRRHAEVFVIVSPPRCASTAAARLLWELEAVRFYCHEPFEVTYYDGRGLGAVAAKLFEPLDLAALSRTPASPGADGLVIKEMPYQVGAHFSRLARLATRPLLFLIRDPRLAIASRMRKKREVGESSLFPKVESGWELLAAQVGEARRLGMAHLIVDTGDLRNQPRALSRAVFSGLGLRFSESLLDWRPCPEVELDNLKGRHRHLYRRVLASRGLQSEKESPPSLDWFPKTDGWRDHVRRCLAIYDQLRTDRVRSRATRAKGKGSGGSDR